MMISSSFCDVPGSKCVWCLCTTSNPAPKLQPDVTTEIHDTANTSRNSNLYNVFLDLPVDTNDRLSRTLPPSFSKWRWDLKLSRIELPARQKTP